MCGRYTLAAPDPAALRARFGLSFEALALQPRYNIAPGDEVAAITTDKTGAPRVESLRWGLVPAFMKEPPPSGRMINARAETAAEKPAFRGSFARFRCLVPADGFYEWGRLWGDPDTGALVAAPEAPKRAFHVTRADGAPFAFAGLWSVWHRGTPEEIRSMSLLTTAPNALMEPLHDRMPAILQPGDEAAWLDAATPAPVLHDLLGGLRDEQMALRPVGPAVNDARHDAPDCLDDPPEPEPAAQTALF